MTPMLALVALAAAGPSIARTGEPATAPMPTAPMAMPPMAMPPAAPPQKPPSPTPSPSPGPDPSMAPMTEMPPGSHGDMPMPAMATHAMAGHAMMTGALAAYPMTRDASGTAWGPDSAPHHGLHRAYGSWTTMVHGYATLIYDDQGGRRGAEQTVVQSHLMAMAQRPLDGGVLTLHGAASLDPFMGKSGYPLLLQTGETADGRTRLIDRQHPHNLVSELSVTYAHPVAADLSAFLYVGDPGEPALGPVTYLHRFAGMANPETPIDHHWLDSTHITFGVVTAGIVRGPLKLEVSDFTGREPDQHRWGFNRARFDSWSTRLTLNPAPNWSMQVSYGRLHSPEQLEPDVDQRRTTASVTYNRPLPHGTWETTLAFGRNQNRPGHDLDAWLAESAVERGADTLFARVERADKDELFTPSSPLAGRIFQVAKLSVGAFHTLPAADHVALDVGALISRYGLPSALHAAYGAEPTSFMLFLRAKIR